MLKSHDARRNDRCQTDILMEEAAQCWGKDHDEILSSFCLNVTKYVYGEDCYHILRSVSADTNTEEQLREAVNFPDPRQFSTALHMLMADEVITTDPIVVNLFAIFQHILFPQFLEFAMEYARIPQDKAPISFIVAKVFKEQTLNAENLVRSLLTLHKDKSLKPSHLSTLIQLLVDKRVLKEDENHCLSFNHFEFIGRLRLHALESLVELNDHRVVEVVRALFSSALFESVLTDMDDVPFDVVTIVPRICEITDLTEAEVMGVLDILRTREYSLISPTEWILTAQNAITCAKMKKIGGLLAEIGYPLARRVINLLLKTEQLETGMLCERILMDGQSGRNLLSQLSVLGVVQSELLEDAPHTTLKKKYIVWKLNPALAVNYASAYLLGVLTKVYFDFVAEKEHLKDVDATFHKPEFIEKRRETVSERITVLDNTIMALTRKYIEIHEL